MNKTFKFNKCYKDFGSYKKRSVKMPLTVLTYERNMISYAYSPPKNLLSMPT